MNTIERKIQNRLESIEETEEEIKALENMIVDERDRIVKFLSNYSSPHHIIECLNQAASDINSIEKKMTFCREHLTRDYKRLAELYKEMEA